MIVLALVIAILIAVAEAVALVLGHARIKALAAQLEAKVAAEIKSVI